jgi:DNA-binding MarR family transcriptional regulator
MALNRPEPPTIGTLAAFLAMDRTTLTAALKPLERRGLVAVTQNPRDRRSRMITLSSSGRELLARAVPIWMETHAEVERLLSAGNAEGLRAALTAVS